MSVETVERWRKPAELLSDDWEFYDVFTDGAGRSWRTPHRTWTLETVERFRLGYLCIMCMEPFERPFPETCPVCEFAVRDHQSVVYEDGYKGKVRLGPEHSLGDIREQDLGTKGMPNIWLPDGHRR